MLTFAYDFSKDVLLAVEVAVDGRMVNLWILFIDSDSRLTFVWVKFVLCMHDTHFIRLKLSKSVLVIDLVWRKKNSKYWTDLIVMSVLSKYFQEAIASATCRDIVHPHTDSCCQAARGYFFKVLCEKW